MRTHSVTLFAALAASLVAAIPVQADPPPWAPAHGRRMQQEHVYGYVYYPAQQVYYSPEQHLWFWMSGGNWQFGISLPAHYHVHAPEGIWLMLGSPRPYVEHVYVEEHYGRPWREKHKDKFKGKDKDKH